MYKFLSFVPHICLGPVHTRPKELENGGFTLKTHQMCFVLTKPEEIKNATWTCLRKTRSEKSQDCHDATRKRKAGVFKFLRFEERFRKAPFCDGLVWTVGLTVEIKLRFQIPPAQCGRYLIV